MRWSPLSLIDHPGMQGRHQAGEGERLDETGMEEVTSPLLERALRLLSRSTARALRAFASFGAANGGK